MMHEQSLAFIEGYVFNALDRKIFKHNRETKDTDESAFKVEAQVPFLWFGITQPTLDVLPIRSKVRIVLDTINNDLCKHLDNTLKDLYTKQKFQTIAVQDKQYVRFITTVLQDKRKLTITEIEHLLGYGVEVVAEKATWEHYKSTPGGIHDTYKCSRCAYTTGWTTTHCGNCGSLMVAEVGGNVK